MSVYEPRYVSNFKFFIFFKQKDLNIYVQKSPFLKKKYNSNLYPLTCHEKPSPSFTRYTNLKEKYNQHLKTFPMLLSLLPTKNVNYLPVPLNLTVSQYKCSLQKAQKKNIKPENNVHYKFNCLTLLTKFSIYAKAKKKVE